MKKMILMATTALILFSNIVSAQEAVTAATDIESLFTSTDPKLQANKQVVYHIVRDLLEANHWELADKFLTKQYLQHNPNAVSGLDGVVTYFTKVRKVKPTPIPEKLQKTKVVSVTAEKDLVVVAYVRDVENKKDPKKSYTTTWFDMWRIKDGKADEHWDSAVRAE